MAYSVETKTTSNPANLLRDELSQAERLLVQLSGANAEAYLVRLDRIEELFDNLDGGELDLRSEHVRWESLLNSLSSQPEPLAAAASKAGGLVKLRANHPPAESFWWHVDAEVTRRRLNGARRLITTLVTLVVVLVGGYWLINAIFPPNPEAVRMLGVNSDIEQFVQTGQWAEALAVVKDAQTELPEEVELLLWAIVLSKQLGLDEEADDALAYAKDLVPDNLPELLSQLGTYYLQVGDVENATLVGQDVFALAPDNPLVTFLLANIAEQINDVATAIDMFERTFALAEEDNPQLAVIARVRMGNLLQRAPSIPQPTPITATVPISGSAMLIEPLSP